jgi:hypothetical protein
MHEMRFDRSQVPARYYVRSPQSRKLSRVHPGQRRVSRRHEADTHAYWPQDDIRSRPDESVGVEAFRPRKDLYGCYKPVTMLSAFVEPSPVT